ncbi:MAG TPA: ATP-grasp domain-containing protein [Methanoregulaceae archaeon]|nr:ATP-grasp domain-containing protein [Methanoregulaceae archaeon]
MNRSVLVVGFSTRHVAKSAFQAGFEVYAIDHFCDQDLAWYTRDRIRFEELGELPVAVEEMCLRHRIDLIIVTSGAESLKSGIPICGTSPEQAKKYLDKLEIQKFFEGLEIPTPQILPDDVYPAMVKPRTGAGGWRNQVVHNREEKELWEERFDNPPYISQALVKGLPSSVCCLADGARARAIAVNEQFLRGNGETAFGFSGSVTPSDSPANAAMIRYAETIAAASGCKGTVGVDFMADSNEVWAIEINPRFQATLDTVEMSTGRNLFSCHLDACHGKLPPHIPPPLHYAARRILFAERDMTVRADLCALHPLVADIPWPNTEMEEGQAVISVYGWGASKDAALAMLDKHNRLVRQYMG